jgi:hypothetical protein
VTPTPAETPTPVETATPTPAGTPVCGVAPLGGCRLPSIGQKASFALKDKTPSTKDQLQWKWIKGAVTLKADFGDPTTTTAYQLCVYDNGGLVLSAAIPPGGTCGTKPCWREKPKGFDYKNKLATPKGVTQIKLQEGVIAGKAQIQVKGKGDLLEDPTLPFVQPVTVQLFNTDGECWEATYSAPAQKNVGPPSPQFKDKAD